MGEACKYLRNKAIAAEAAATAAAAKQQMAMSGCQNSDLYKYFSTQLASARLMDKKNEFNCHLNEIDKQHKFIILRSLAGCM